MLFKTKFHEGIRNGLITLTFRAWKSAGAKVGKQYRFGPEEGVEVGAVDEVVVSAIMMKKPAVPASGAPLNFVISLLRIQATR